MHYWILNKVKNSLISFFKKGFNLLIVFLALFFFVFSAPLAIQAKIQNDLNGDGTQTQRSLESVRDLESKTWQVVVYPRDSDNQIVLRIVGFPGSLRLNHPEFLKVEAGIKTWDLEDITLQNSLLVQDSREAAAEFKLQPLLLDLQSNRPLRLSLPGAFNALPIPPYVVEEWRSFLKTNSQND